MQNKTNCWTCAKSGLNPAELLLSTSCAFTEKRGMWWGLQLLEYRRFNIAPCKLAQSETISQRFFIPTRKYLLYVNSSSESAPCFGKINIGFVGFIAMTLRGLKFQPNCFLLLKEFFSMKTHWDHFLAVL